MNKGIQPKHARRSPRAYANSARQGKTKLPPPVWHRFRILCKFHNAKITPPMNNNLAHQISNVKYLIVRN